MYGNCLPVDEGGNISFTNSPYPPDVHLLRRFKNSFEIMFAVDFKNEFEGKVLDTQMIEAMKNFVITNANQNYVDDVNKGIPEGNYLSFCISRGHPEWYNEYRLVLRGYYFRVKGGSNFVSVPIVPGYQGPAPWEIDPSVDDDEFDNAYGNFRPIFSINTSLGQIEIYMIFQTVIGM